MSVELKITEFIFFTEFLQNQYSQWCLLLDFSMNVESNLLKVTNLIQTSSELFVII